jgi:catecholate siderophore receptor
VTDDLTDLFNNTGTTACATSCVTDGKAVHDLWSPKFSAIWEPSETATFYATYSKALNPPGNSVANGDTLGAEDTFLDPESTETFDIGAKFSLLNKHLLVQTAVYQTNRKNSVEVDPATNELVASSEPRQRLRGFELGVSGAVTPEFLLNLNYAYIDAKYRASADGAVDDDIAGNQVRYVPEHAVSGWASYKPVAGGLKGLEIGGGMNYQSKVYLNPDNNQVVPSYVSFDALIAYNIGKFRVALNGYNLGNELYYAQVNSSRIVPASGRTFVGTVGVSF